MQKRLKTSQGPLKGPRSAKTGNGGKRRQKPVSKWKKKITAEAGHRLRVKSKQNLPDTSAIRWL
jgi:hypothetical protein